MRHSFTNFKLSFPLELLRKMTNVNPIIINYHVVSNLRLPYIIHLYKYRNIKTFTEDILFFKRKYHSIGLTEFLDSIKNNTKLPKNSFLITFDDGFREIFEFVAPILLENKLTTTVFITKNYLDNAELGYDNKKSLILEKLCASSINNITNKIQDLLQSFALMDNDLHSSILNIPYAKRTVVDEIASLINLDFSEFLDTNKPYLTTPQIHELKSNGITFGGHSIDHPKFTELSLEEQINQAITSTEFISEILRLDYKVFAFPYSDRNLPVSFFNSISDRLDATFGTQGILKDSIVNNFQRLNVEKYEHKAINTLKFHYTKKIIYQLLKKDIINRS